MQDKRNKPELLAPAGDMERLKMAVAYGADAVYLAGTSFGMRAFAGNFTPEELRQAVAYAHERGVRVFLTLNTLLTDRELPLALDAARTACRLGVDSVLVQDWGLFALLREALHIVDIGAATFEDVDTVLKAGMGLRYAALGPFGVADFGGLDTFDHINSYLNAELDDSKVGNKRLHEMVEAGKLGVKSGQGFYDYSGDKADAAIRERDRLYIELAKVLYFKK